MQTQSNELDEQLSAYFDGELEASVRALVEDQLAADDALASRLADLSFMQTVVVGSLEHQAERVPEARFEQLWDNFEQTLERESRLQEAAEAPPSLWQRLASWARPLRIPITAVAAAGALIVVFARSAGDPADGDSLGDGAGEDSAAELASNTPAGDSSDAQPNAESPEAAPPGLAPAPQPEARVAVATDPDPELDPEMFPQPEPGEAEIRRIEFGGRAGVISQVEGTRGTTTVIWVTEDSTPVDSERSL